jgi:hypothetical protein
LSHCAFVERLFAAVRTLEDAAHEAHGVRGKAKSLKQGDFGTKQREPARVARRWENQGLKHNARSVQQ